jgi:hypothetical protein
MSIDKSSESSDDFDITCSFVNKDKYENQLPSGNSMESQNILKDHLHMPQLRSDMIGNQPPRGNSLLSDQKTSRVPFDMSIDKSSESSDDFDITCSFVNKDKYENQLPSGNSMESQNVLKDHLHMPLLISEKIENQLPSGNSLLIDQKASRVPFDVSIDKSSESSDDFDITYSFDNENKYENSLLSDEKASGVPFDMSIDESSESSDEFDITCIFDNENKYENQLPSENILGSENNFKDQLHTSHPNPSEINIYLKGTNECVSNEMLPNENVDGSKISQEGGSHSRLSESQIADHHYMLNDQKASRVPFDMSIDKSSESSDDFDITCNFDNKNEYENQLPSENSLLNDQKASGVPFDVSILDESSESSDSFNESEEDTVQVSKKCNFDDILRINTKIHSEQN